MALISIIMSEAQKEARKIMNRQLHHVSGVPELYIDEFHKGDSHIETARKCSIEVAKEMQREHSCETLNNERWQFWSDVESALNVL
jgi:hypothetical protein